MTDNGEYVTLYRTIGKMHPTLNKQVSDNLLLFTITQKGISI
jgi:hypothetical protein